MSLRIMQVGNSLPYSWPVNHSSTFQAGMIAQLGIQGNSIVAGVSDGTAPIGIIDDQRSKAFTAVSWDEEIVVSATGVDIGGGVLTTPIDIKAELANANVLPDTFVSIPVSIQLIPRNGVIVFPAGTELNYDRLGTGTPNAIRTFVRYNYQIPNVLGDDTTAGSQRITVWFQRGIYQTDIFDSSAAYPLNANLYVNEKGLLTTKQLTPYHPSIAIVTAAPNISWPWCEFLYL